MYFDNQIVMAIFNGHKIDIKQLLGVIPEALLSHLSESTKVDYYSKVLHGKKMFYLLIYGLLENDRLSQRTLEDTFNDPVFKILFKLDMEESVRRSSISERLSKIDSAFFKQLYEHIYGQFSQLYPAGEGEKYNLIRVDSTVVSDISGKMSAGLENNGRKSIKYTMAFDGTLPCLSELFTKPTYSSEDMALPEVVKNHVKQETGHLNIYLLDRGFQSANSMQSFSKEEITFIARIKEKRKYKEVESLMTAEVPTDLDSLTLLKDCIVHLYGSKIVTSKSGKSTIMKYWLKSLFG